MPRGRPRRLAGHELVEQLNAAVAELIKENRKLKRQNESLSARATKGRAGGNVDRSLRGIQKRVQKALTAPTRRRRRKGASATAKRTTRKRKAA